MYAEREAAVEDMPKYTKYLEFSQKERTAIRERDNYMCIFCQVGYRMPPANEMGKNMQDIMHYIPRSSLGLGIRQNGAVGCRYHHNMMDNGSSGDRKEMLEMFKSYLDEFYPDFTDAERKYDKWSFLKEKPYV